ncbi:kynurenine--oxoglutarate transaminase 3-like [Anneissia japonica]|uniref:kynurenine--oxoglutarate transaminase 3-like n=1 Tax=Anneissia japonica TaxID=1529436 RepID=UPI001425737D|nr:kynurenine--oxoglutarate transaminase 3-like [Anneissia japonica]
MLRRSVAFINNCKYNTGLFAYVPCFDSKYIEGKYPLEVNSSHQQYRKMSKHGPANRIVGLDKNVWVEFSALAAETKALNLGQGFPDFAAPAYMTAALKDVVTSSNPLMNQYTRAFGHTRLVNALAALYGKCHNRTIEPTKEILVTVGAYGSLFNTIMGLVNPGDEVIIIEPFFDCYQPMVLLAGAVPKYIPLKPKENATSTKDWVLDPKELDAMFNDKTKMIIVNNPNNPLGKVFTKDELTMIAELCKKHDVICLSDEVYEWMIYTGNKHERIATYPGMWERTITVGSAGKTFSATGWKLGWSIGPENLINGLRVVHQHSIYCCPTPLQEAVAIGLETEFARLNQPDCYLSSLAEELEEKRNKVCRVLKDIGLEPIVPDGGYFVIADISKIEGDFEDGTSSPKDYKFVRWLTRTVGVATIPPSAFFSDDHKYIGEKYIRICFIKEDSTLDKGLKLLQTLK